MNTFGQLFRITTFGESHGGAVGVVIDGCPAGVKLDIQDFRQDLDRRRTGQSPITSARREDDQVEILSGVFEGMTIGSPICLMVRNTNAKGEDYEMLKNTYRPSHADFTYEQKYGIRNWKGGGRASARETVARVMAGVVAKKILSSELGIRSRETGVLPGTGSSIGSKEREMEVLAYVKQIGKIETSVVPEKVTLQQVESNIVRCPDAKVAKKMIERIQAVQKKGDTIGGVVECVIRNVPAGLGDPVFGKLKASLAQAMMSLPATMGVEFGSGFGSLEMLGSEHNDAFMTEERKNPTTSLRASFRTKERRIVTKSNNSGGIQGGVSNGMPIVFRVCFKPVATVFQDQQTVTKDGKKHTLKMYGRHDPCVVPRAVVIVEAMAAIVVADALLKQKVSKI